MEYLIIIDVLLLAMSVTSILYTIDRCKKRIAEIENKQYIDPYITTSTKKIDTMKTTKIIPREYVRNMNDKDIKQMILRSIREDATDVLLDSISNIICEYNPISETYFVEFSFNVVADRGNYTIDNLIKDMKMI